MAWLRLDDKFAQHPKVAGLSHRAFRTHLETMLYVAEYRTDGAIPAASYRLTGATHPVRRELVSAGLWDDAGDVLTIHDWRHYNGGDAKAVAAERQRRHRDKTVTDTVTLPLQKRDSERDKNVTRAQARGGVPNPNPTEVANATSVERPPDELWDALTAELGEAKTKSERGQRNKARKELHEIGATAEDIRLRCAQYRRTWPQLTLTDIALVKHWSRMAPVETPAAPPVEEVLNLPEADIAANLEHVRELAGAIGKDVA